MDSLSGGQALTAQAPGAYHPPSQKLLTGFGIEEISGGGRTAIWFETSAPDKAGQTHRAFFGPT